MSLTMPRRYGRTPGPPGERRVACDTCGLVYYRSTMVRTEGGLLRCTDGCNEGRETYELNRANAAGALGSRTPRPRSGRW